LCPASACRAIRKSDCSASSGVGTSRVRVTTRGNSPCRAQAGNALVESAPPGSSPTRKEPRDARRRGVAERFVCATNRQPLALLGLERCENVLRYVRAWRQICAMAAPAWHGHSAGEGARTPNSVQSFTPDNLQSGRTCKECGVGRGESNGRLSYTGTP
jgi:hypothetical protein